jgi:beta-phosphoglucomutase-like phosphatase (HAD superfamily)
MGVATLDIDGTLVDTKYHHTIAWSRAFAQFEIVLPLWQVTVTSAWVATR